MKELSATNIQAINASTAMETISMQLDKLEKHTLEYTPWSSYPYKPKVQFAIAHADACVLIKFFVAEKSIRAAAGKTNGDVWKDACVEMFISFDETGYYNFEFNCIGTALAGFGKDKKTKQRLPDALIENIETRSVIVRQTAGDVHWELAARIPFTVFAHQQLKSLAGKECRGNFYKCGDDLPEPHFVAWANIIADKPNFHLPAFFGKIKFV